MRKQVVDALLQGKSLREVGKIAGVSHTVVQDYKRKVFIPALKTAQQIQSLQPLAASNLEVAQEQIGLTRTIVSASPFRDRLEKLWAKCETAVETAEIQQLAPILGQAHKNLEMLGRATGELESVTNNSVQIQIVVPSGPAYGSKFEAEAIDIALPKR